MHVGGDNECVISASAFDEAVQVDEGRFQNDPCAPQCFACGRVQSVRRGGWIVDRPGAFPPIRKRQYFCVGRTTRFKDTVRTSKIDAQRAGTPGFDGLGRSIDGSTDFDGACTIGSVLQCHIATGIVDLFCYVNARPWSSGVFGNDRLIFNQDCWLGRPFCR